MPLPPHPHPLSQHLGISCLRLSGSEGARLSLALTPHGRQALLSESQGVLLWGRGCPLSIFISKRSLLRE